MYQIKWIHFHKSGHNLLSFQVKSQPKHLGCKEISPKNLKGKPSTLDRITRSQDIKIKL